MGRPLVSICIPTYKRPKELNDALNSIDTKYVEDLEIYISENCSVLQKETREIVENFKKRSPYKVTYFEQVENVGYDRNIRSIVNKAEGEYIVFLSDDDEFVPNALDGFIDFIRSHQNCGYILRSYRNYYLDGSYQDFRYYKEEQIFPPSDDTYIKMFDKSIFLSGFTIKKDLANKFQTDTFDGSLLYQLYILAEVCRISPAANCNIIISQAYEGGTPHFGDSKVEHGLYEPGKMSANNTLNFLKWYIKVIDFISNKYHNNTNEIIKYNMSKYSYPSLAEEKRRNSGYKAFKKYCCELKKMGLAKSKLFYVYYYALLIFGVKICDKTIQLLKRIIGHRPQL